LIVFMSGIFRNWREYGRRGRMTLLLIGKKSFRFLSSNKCKRIAGTGVTDWKATIAYANDFV
jgi:hypothetical protein